MGVSVSKTRDKHGLLPQQRMLLQELMSARSWKEVSAESGLRPRTLNRWLRADPAFRAAYDKLFDDKGEAVRKEISFMAGKAADTLESAFDATDVKTKEVECPQCKMKFDVVIDKPNWAARMKAIEIATRVGGQLKDVKKIEGTVTHMTIEQQIALGLINNGQESRVPPHVIEELKRLNMLDKTGADELDFDEMTEYVVSDEPEFEEVDREPVYTEEGARLLTGPQVPS